MTEKHTKGSMSLSTERVQNGYHHVLMIASELTAVGAVYGSTNAMWDSVPGAVEGEANARRIVACWNACDGMSTETLEGALGGLLMHGGFVALWSDYCDKKAEAQNLREQRDELLHARKVLGAERIVLGFQRDQLLKALEAIRANEDADGDVLREQAHSAIEAYEDDAKARRLGLRGQASTSAPAPGKLPGNATN